MRTPVRSLTITTYKRVPLTELEKRDKHEELVRTINDKKRLEENFALLREQHKANLKARETTISELSQELGQGFVMMPVTEQVTDERA